jgi:hypothetical protein
MSLSAELRWFWPEAEPHDLAAWFRGAAAHQWPAGGGRLRDDTYIVDRVQPELGIKHRGGASGVELKRRCGTALQPCEDDPFRGVIEFWARIEPPMRLIVPVDAAVVEVSKRRWLRMFDTGGETRQLRLNEDGSPWDTTYQGIQGCQVELTEIELPHRERWVTLGFESFGPVESLLHSLRAIARWLAQRHAPGMDGAIEASYPAWLCRTVGPASVRTGRSESPQDSRDVRSRSNVSARDA